MIYVRITQQGFTLIELLIIVLIIGILAAIALPQYQKAVMRSRYNSMKHLVQAIVHSQEVYYLANNQYASAFRELDVDAGGIPQNTNDFQRNFNWGYCQMSNTAYAYMLCYNTLINMGYQAYFAQSTYNASRRYCYTNSNDLTTLQHRVCKGETGKETPTGGNTSNPMWRY